MNIIIPKTYVKEFEYPVIFLAGPAKGAPHWQDKAIEIISSQESNIIIVSPRQLIKEIAPEFILKGDENFFPRQRAWERHYLNISSKKGAIMFWLPEEVEHNCEKVYGAMTRLELGQSMTNYKYDNNFRFCVGSDGKFPELRTIEYDLSIDAPDKKIFSTLEETCAEALKIAFKSP